MRFLHFACQKNAGGCNLVVRVSDLAWSILEWFTHVEAMQIDSSRIHDVLWQSHVLGHSVDRVDALVAPLLFFDRIQSSLKHRWCQL